METRFVKIDRKEIKVSQLRRVYSLEVSNESFCDFYSKLYTMLGKENQIMDEGFSFYIKDTKTDVKFSADLTGFGAGYFGKEEDLEVILEFEKIRQKQIPVDCQMEYAHDFGKTILGAKNGIPFSIEIENEED